MQLPIVSIASQFDAPMWAISCLMCGQYTELAAGAPRPNGVRCVMCRSATLIDTASPLRSSGLPSGISLGRTVGTRPTLGGVQDWR